MSVEHLRPVPPAREVVGSKAFNLEYLPPEKSDVSIKNDIVSYLGEYRFEIPRYEYDMLYSKDDTGKISIFTPDHERMLGKSKKSIVERKLRGDPTHREENETIGLLSLEEQLETSNNGDTVFWASPPGPKSEGYGDYGFIYHGKVKENRLEMSALRVEKPIIEQYNSAMRVLTGREFNYDEADEFLSSPILVDAEISDKFIEKVLKHEFSFIPNEKKQKEFEDIINILTPLIDRAIYSIKNGSKKEKLDSFYALENYALELRNKNEAVIEINKQYLVPHYNYDVDHIIATRSYQPPIARGSCGATGGTTQSNMLFSGDSVLNNVLGSDTDKYGSREFDCPKCHKKNLRPKNQLLEKCQHCGSRAVSCEDNSEANENYQEAS